jgi:hypothetical protein
MTVKDRLEFFDSGHGLTAVKLGIVPLGQLVKYDLYRTYLDHLDNGRTETEARRLTIIERKVEYWDITRAIYFFEPDVVRRPGKKARFAESCK